MKIRIYTGSEQFDTETELTIQQLADMLEAGVRDGGRFLTTPTLAVAASEIYAVAVIPEQPARPDPQHMVFKGDWRI